MAQPESRPPTLRRELLAILFLVIKLEDQLVLVEVLYGMDYPGPHHGHHGQK